MNNIQQESNVALRLTINETNVVIAALRELPHRVVSELITNVMNQVQTQIQTMSQPISNFNQNTDSPIVQ